MKIMDVELLGEQRSCVVVEVADRDGDELLTVARANDATQQMDGHEMVLMRFERENGNLDDPDLYRLDAMQGLLSRRPRSDQRIASAG